MEPQTIGRYQVISELGRGAMGLVYKAVDPNIGRTVALKTLRLDGAGIEFEEIVRRFKNEARAAGLLNHPNIVTIYDAGEFAGMFYIAMEYIEGVTLHKVIAEQRILPIDKVMNLSRQICFGLDYAHQHGVIHRDVKPANMMLTSDGSLKIMDFGIAKAGGGMTSTGQVLGTPNYMSPEQVKGHPLDGRSDLFSFGVMLYEMVTGEKPFGGQNITTIIYKIVNENPIPPRELDMNVHAGLNAVITKALAKNPEERYQKGADLVADLENYRFYAGPSGGSAPAVSAAIAASDMTQISATPLAAGSSRSAETRTAAPATAKPATAKPGITRPGGPVATPARSVPNPPAQAGRFVPPSVGSVAAGEAQASTVDVFPKSGGGAPGARAASRAGGKAAYRPGAKGQMKVWGAVALGLIILGGAFAYWKRSGGTERGENRAAVESRTEAGGNGTRGTEPSAASAVAARKLAHLKNKFESAKAKPPAPAAVPVKDTGIILNSYPQGAQVTIDGQAGGKTPFKALKLSAGIHALAFTKPGYAAQTHSVDVEPGKVSSLSVTLSPQGSTVVVSSNPSGAAIFVDGKNVGKITPSEINVQKKGSHKIVLRLPGFKEASGRVFILEGEASSFSATLQPQGGTTDEGTSPLAKLGRWLGRGSSDKGRLSIRTSPPGAQVILNGQPRPNTTPIDWPLNAGSYDIVLKLNGYRPLHKVVNVEQGKSVDLTETLEPDLHYKSR